jgi:hypothetical protein
MTRALSEALVGSRLPLSLSFQMIIENPTVHHSECLTVPSSMIYNVSAVGGETGADYMTVRKM